MYKIVKDGQDLVMTEAPTYIRKAGNGCYVLCPAEEAEGVAWGGHVFRLLGREAPEGMAELEAVMLEETDAGGEITRAAETGGIMFVTLAEAGSIDATTAAEHADLFAPWTVPVNYKTGQIRRYTDGKLYQCLQDHTSQEDWTPSASPSLWKQVADPAEEWPEWSQPVGAHDAYSAGDRVRHASKHWTSDVDGNVWEPGVYAWTEAAKV